MARAGLFNDVDAVIAWHPGDGNRVTSGSSLGNINAKFRFYGKPSHAAAAPDQGRSALDGLMIMSMAVEMMREHVPSTTRIHYIFTKGGGAPNVIEGHRGARLLIVWKRSQPRWSALSACGATSPRRRRACSSSAAPRRAPPAGSP